MSITETLPRVANSSISTDLYHEKAAEPFHVGTVAADFTFDEKRESVLCVSESLKDSDLASDDSKTSEVSQTSRESDLALDNEQVLEVSATTTDSVLALDNDRAADVSETPTEAVPAPGDDNASSVYKATTETDITQGDSSDVTETSNKILDVIFDYALNKFDDTKERLAAGAPKFLSIIEGFVKEEKQVQMCLPAFPFKSANKVYKVLGTLPDKAEELALNRLNSMCVSIGDFYHPGAKLTIISDGLVYNGSCNQPSNVI